MATKELQFDEEARHSLERGVYQLARAVRVTLGPRGRTVVLEKKYGSPSIINDGVTIAREIEAKDPFENMGVQLAREVASKTNDIAGDGTTTATVLAHAIVSEGMRAVTAGASPLQVKNGIDRAVEAIVASIQANAIKVEGQQGIAQVATIAANDAKIGQLVAEAMEKVGKDGIITVEESKGTTTQLKVVEGMQFDKGYVSPYFVTDPERMEVTFEDPYILLFEKKISAAQDIIPLLEKISQVRAPLVVIAEDIDGEALATLVVNRLRGTIASVAIKAPGFGDRRKAMMSDIAVLVGGKFYSEELGVKMENIALEDLGRAKKVIVTKDDTTLIEGAGSQSAINGHIAQIRKQITETESDYDREKLQERLAKLCGGVAVVQVGAATETALKEMKSRIEDAMNATRAAVEEGIVPGGGVALLNAKSALEGLPTEEDEEIGVNIIRHAIEAPARQIALNSGAEGSVVVDKIKSLAKGYGYDAARKSYVDMVASGIVDPAKVVRVALQNAASIAGLILTTECLVCEAPEPQSAVGNGVSAPMNEMY